MLVSLISVPLIIRSLGNEDYGLYAMLAGVVALLAFLNASMTVSTQRYLSMSFGENDTGKVNKVFTISILLHLIISSLIVIIMEACTPLLFNGFLNIPQERLEASKIVYQMLIAGMFLTIVTTPFVALLNAKENMLAFSIINISENILRLLLAIWLLYCGFDKLVSYSVGMVLITLASSIVTMLFTRYRYNDCVFSVKRYYDTSLFKEMVGFVSWNTLGAVAMLFRNQGGAVIVNWFFYAIGNAAYGIANQINGAVNYFSANIQRAVNPQIMQSEGQGNRQRLEQLTTATSKYSIMIIGFIVVPLIIEMPSILRLWIGENVPDGTAILSRLILVLCLISQASMGLMAYVQAIGKIRNYFITISALLILSLPLAYCAYYLGGGIEMIAVSFIIVECICLVARLIFANATGGLNVRKYFNQSILQAMFPICLAGIIAICTSMFLPSGLIRIILVFVSYWMVFGLAAWYWGTDDKEKQYIISKALPTLNFIRKRK